MSNFKISIAINGDDGKIYAIRTQKKVYGNGVADVVVECNEITEHALNVVAKYMKDNGLGRVKTDFGYLSLLE